MDDARRRYRVGPLQRAVNATVMALVRAGFGPPRMAVLTTRGRRSGAERSVPVTPLEREGRRYLVAPYGEVGWVHNARAAGGVSLRRGRDVRQWGVREVGAEEAGPILKQYVGGAPIVLPFFDADRGAPPAAFAAEADRHPVFELVERPV